MAGRPNPCDHPLVKRVLSGARKTYSTPPQPKTSYTDADLKVLLDSLVGADLSRPLKDARAFTSTVAQWRLAWLCQALYYHMARFNCFAVLATQNVTYDAEKRLLCVRFESRKADLYNEGSESLAAANGSRHCPYRLHSLYLERLARAQNGGGNRKRKERVYKGLLLPALEAGSTSDADWRPVQRPVPSATMRKAFDLALRAVHQKPAHGKGDQTFGFTSFRRGAAAKANDMGYDQETIAKAGNWKQGSQLPLHYGNAGTNARRVALARSMSSTGSREAAGPSSAKL